MSAEEEQEWVPREERPRSDAHEAMYPLFLVVRTAPVSRTINDRETRVTVSLCAGVHEVHLATGLLPGAVNHKAVLKALADQMRPAAKAAVGPPPKDRT